MKERRIAIIGAGIGGLAAAALLHQAGRDVTIFERFDSPRPVGSGLVIQPVGLAVLDALGAGGAARAHAAPIARMIGHSGPHRALDVSYPADAPGLAMHRASLFHVLWQVVQAAGIGIVTDAQIEGLPPDGLMRHVLHRDGTLSGPYDLIVDASGAGSPFSALKARALPYGAIWGHVPWPAGTALSRDMLHQAYRGAANMAGILPIGPLPGDATPRAAVFWSMPVAALADWAQSDLAEWKARVTALWPAMALFLEGISQTGDMTTARYAHGTLARPYAAALVHIGDAAHRASPQLGQGANMALLDAYALSEALRGPWEDALPAYAKLRRWHVRAYQGLSAAFTPMYQSDSRILPLLRDRILAPLGELPFARTVLTRIVAGRIVQPLAGVNLA
ncbi:MAG: FAD-dependent oxidoreductase [Paracoccaceae bacterium]